MLKFIFVGALIIYLNLFQYDLWNKYINVDYFFTLNVLFIYNSVPKTQKNEQFTKFHFFLRLHKFFILQYLYTGSFLTNWNALLSQVKVILAFQLLGFVLPKHLILRICTFPPLNALMAFSSKIIGSGAVLAIFQQTVLSHAKTGNFISYITPDNANLEFIVLNCLLGILGPVIILVFLYFQLGFSAVKQKASTMIITMAIVWIGGALFTLFAYQNDEILGSYLLKIGVQYENSQILISALLNIYWVIQDLALLTITPSQNKPQLKSNSEVINKDVKNMENKIIHSKINSKAKNSKEKKVKTH